MDSASLRRGNNRSKSGSHRRDGPQILGPVEVAGLVFVVAVEADGDDLVVFFGGDIDVTIDAWNRIRDRVAAVGRPVENSGGEYVALPRDGITELASEIDAWRNA